MGYGYTGRLFEEEFFAVCQGPWWDGHSYVPFRKALWLVETHQPEGWNPSEPSTRAARDLHCQVAIALDLEDFAELSLFTALHSPLDLFHGTDGVIEWRGKVVTVDLTTNPHKDSYKADIILHPEDEGDDWREAGVKIARLLQNKGAYAA